MQQVASAPDPVVAAALRGFSVIAQHQGATTRAVQTKQQSIDAWRALGLAARHAPAAPSCPPAAAQVQLSLGLFELGRLHLAQGNHTKARELLEESLAIDRALAADGVNRSADWAATVHALGDVLAAQGDDEGARSRWTEAHAMVEVVLQTKPMLADEDAIGARHALGRHLLTSGEPSSAAAHFEAALEADCALHGATARRPERASILADLAVAVRDAYGDEAVAVARMEASLAIWRDLLIPSNVSAEGGDGSASADAAGGGDDGSQAGRRTLANQYYPPHGPAHPIVAANLQALGIFAKDRAEYERARDLLEASLEMAYELFGEGTACEQIGHVILPLCCVLRQLGSLRSASQGLRYALAIFRELYGTSEPEPSIAVTLHELGATLMLVDGSPEHTEALACLEASLSMYEVLYAGAMAAEIHPDVAMTLHDLGAVRLARGELSVARERFNEALALKRAIYGSESVHPTIAATLLMIGQVYVAMRDWDSACDFCEASLAQYERSFGALQTSRHPDVTKVKGILDDVCARRAKAARCASCPESGAGGAAGKKPAYSRGGRGRLEAPQGEPVVYLVS
jgi:tetratricopeptide (TPR) repeat protein